MTPFWHPLSALLFRDPRVFVTPTLLRMTLASEGRVALVYAGDAMWPTVSHGQELLVEPLGGAPPSVGETVVASPEGVPELVRVEGIEGGSLRVVADAVPGAPTRVELAGVLARARVARRSTRAFPRSCRRLALELREALLAGADRAPDPAATVRAKYETQAPFYARGTNEEIEAPLLAELRRRVAPGARILVAGSGAGKECFALEREGWTITGIDFAPSMVAAARAEGTRRGSSATFLEADLRSHAEPAESVGAILFTYDVYSFVPDPADRVRILARMGAWLRPGGVVLLSARRVQSTYGRFILTAERLGRGRTAGGAWGASHTRWIAPDGSMRRSFVQVFSPARLRREIVSAGLRPGELAGGHVVLEAGKR